MRSCGEKKEDGRLTIASTKACTLHCYLDLVLLRGPKGALFEAHVLLAVEDDCVLLSECDGRHGERGRRMVLGEGQGGLFVVI
jgi:hypothetical protein